jgi:hypothetical protein
MSGDDWDRVLAEARQSEADAARAMPDEEVVSWLSHYNDPGNEPVYGDCDLWGVYYDEAKRRWGERAALERLNVYDNEQRAST